MANKLIIPSVVGVGSENMTPGHATFLQAIGDALNVLDNNVVYKDVVKTVIPPLTIRASSAQGQSFSVENVNLASGDDYAVLVNDFKAFLTHYVQFVTATTSLINELQGK